MNGWIINFAVLGVLNVFAFVLSGNPLSALCAGATTTALLMEIAEARRFNEISTWVVSFGEQA